MITSIFLDLQSEAIGKKKVIMEKRFEEKLKNVKAFVFDVDGVLSTSSIPLALDGTPNRVVSTKDGYALHLAAVKGVRLCIITGGNTQGIRVRFEGLGFQDIYMGAAKKIKTLNDYVKKEGITLDDVLFMGDDIPDYECMKASGLCACPVDAADEIKAIADYVSPKAGGQGCVRDVMEKYLKVKGIWMTDVEAFGW